MEFAEDSDGIEASRSGPSKHEASLQMRARRRAPDGSLCAVPCHSYAHSTARSTGKAVRSLRNGPLIGKHGGGVYWMVYILRVCIMARGVFHDRTSSPTLLRGASK